MTTKKQRDSSVNIDDESTTNRDVEVDRDTTVDRDTNVDVSVEASSADAEPEPEDKGPAPESAVIPADQVDWTVDYGGDAVHPTEIPREDYIIPLPTPEEPVIP